MFMDNYLVEAHHYAAYDDKDYPYYALVEEVGELMGKLAKQKRGDKGITEPDIMKEMGDILWQFSAICVERGYSMGMIAEMNLKKLEDRKNRNTIKGSGDDR